MGIKKNAVTGKWDVSVAKRHPKTRQPKSKRRVGVATEAQARRIEKELYAELVDELKRQVIPTWRRCVFEFIEHFKTRDISLKTVDTYRLCLESHTIPIWGDRLVNTLTTDEIRLFIVSLEKKVSESHRKNILKYIRAVLTYASGKHYISHLEAPKISFRIGQKLEEVLNESQARLLLSKAKECEIDWYPIWAVALMTGMRSGELFALSWEKVDLVGKRIKVDCSWNNKDGFKGTKSGHHRFVPISDELLTILSDLKIKKENAPFVLPHLEKWKKGEAARELRLFLMGLGLPRICFHSLRASWATILIGKGVAPYKLQIAGGWIDLSTLARYLRKAGVEVDGMTNEMRLLDPMSRLD